MMETNQLMKLAANQHSPALRTPSPIGWERAGVRVPSDSMARGLSRGPSKVWRNRIVGHLILLFAFAATGSLAQTNLVTVAEQNAVGAVVTNDSTVLPPSSETAAASDVEKIRDACIQGRHVICGRVIKILPDGLVVDSGYTALLHPPFGQDWVVSRRALVGERDREAIETTQPGSPCYGLVLLTDLPKRPKVKRYDYVILMGYPAGHYIYTPLPKIRKEIRKFAAGLDTAVRLTAEDKP